MMYTHPVALSSLTAALTVVGSGRGVATALDYPIGITNCGEQSWIPKPPERAVTMNQGTTEVMLALGLADRMVGTAYLDDYIWPELEEDYKSVPVLSDKYPTVEQLMEVNPDFVYASYSSAFATSYVNYTQILGDDECSLVIQRDNGENRSHCRAELHELGIQTYLQKPYCELSEHRPVSADTIDVMYDEIWDIASIFGIYDEARRLVDSIEGHFRDASALVSAAEQSGVPPISVLWLDGWDAETPFVGACCGPVQTIIDKAGAKHILDDQGVEDKKSWDSVGWDVIAERDPDLIVLVDASWDLAHEKIFHLCSNETTRALRAVQNRAFIQVPFSASTLGVRIGALAYNLAEAFSALVRGGSVPSLQFTPTSIADDGTNSSLQALSKSGARIFEELPVWNGTDLNELCPGSNSPLQIRDDIPLQSIEEAKQKIEELEAQVDQAKSDAESEAQRNKELQAAQEEAKKAAQEKQQEIDELESEVERLTEITTMTNEDEDEDEDLEDISGSVARMGKPVAIISVGIVVVGLLGRL